MTHDGPDRRRTAKALGSLLGTGGWLTLSDDDLLYQIEALGQDDHGQDETLMEVVRSERHFFIRQEAAKKIRDPDLLKTFEEDRHIGQILVRQMEEMDMQLPKPTVNLAQIRREYHQAAA